ncbi:MAG: GAF domain-containing protein, partial [Anaerolineae bacterium]|nr:GAF domain-containing protein [Anaerolineae bacterium]
FMERVHPDDSERVALATVQLRSLVEPQQIEFRIVWPDGHIRWLSIRMYPAGGIADTRQRIIGLTDDITERKQIEQAEHEQRVLAESFRDIAETLSRTLDLDEVLDLIMETMGGVIPLDSASLMLEKQGKICIVRDRGFSATTREKLMQGEFDFQHLPNYLQMAESRNWMIIDDVLQEPTWKDFNVAHVLRSYLGVPILVEGKMVGLISADSRTPGFFTAEHAEKLKSFATQAAIAIQNARLYTELRNSEQRFREIADTISEVFWVFDTQQSRYMYVSRASEKIWKLRPDVVYQDSNTLRAILHPDDETRFDIKTVDAVHMPIPQHAEFRIIWPDGSVRWMSSHVYPTDVNGQQRIIGVTEDITERKRIEQAEREQRVLAESFRDIAETLSRTLDLDEVLDLIMETLGRVVPSDSASLMLEERGKVRIVRARGFDESVEAYLLQHQFTFQEVANFVKIAETRDWLIIDDVLESSLWKPFEVPLSIRSYLGVPILIEGNMVGLLNIDHHTPGFFTPDHAAKTKIFAAQAAIAIQNARLYKQAQELATIEERQRLARELHDAVSQTLFSASVIAETLPRIYQRQSPTDMQRGLQELNRLTRGAMAEMRTLLAELRPRALLDGDLPTLVKQLADAAAGHVEADFMVELPPRCVLPAEVKLVFYRIAQEALSNIVKHSRARTVHVRMVRADDAAWLEIADDGRGFDPQQLVSGHYGLQIMRERAEAVGAHLEMHSEPGQGTQLHLHWREPVIEAI